MLDHQDQISIPAAVARGPVYISAFTSYSCAYDTTDVMDNDSLQTVLTAQIVSRAYNLSQKMGHYP